MHDIPREILKKASQGDVDSFEVIYKTFSGFVYAVAFRVLNSKEEAEEVAQEVFLTIYHKLKSFRFQSSLKTWVYRVSLNCALNRSKKITNEKKKMVDYDENLIGEQPSHESANDVNQKDGQARINSLLARLNADQRACMVLRSIEGFSYREISQALNININTVRSRLKRAREILLLSRNEVVSDEVR